MDLDAVIKQIMPFIQEIMGGTLKTSGSGMIGRMKEIGALGMFLKDAPQKFAGNDLIDGLVKSLLDNDTEVDKYVDLDTLEPSAVLDKLGGLNDILNGLEGNIGAQVKEFIFGLASSVAGAAGTGLFGTGQKVTREEESFLNGLKDKLGL